MSGHLTSVAIGAVVATGGYLASTVAAGLTYGGFAGRTVAANVINELRPVVYRALQGFDEPAGIFDVERATGIRAALAHRVLTRLTVEGWVKSSEENGRGSRRLYQIAELSTEPKETTRG